MPENNDFAKHIDNLREARNISREDFVDGIISLRQYYRFVKGESSLKNDTLQELLQKLNFNSVTEYIKYFSVESDIYSQLCDAYYEVTIHDLVKSREKLNKINKDELKTKANKTFYRLIELEILYLQNMTPIDVLIEEISTLIDYPKILEVELITFVETSALVLLNNLLAGKREDYTITNFLYTKIKGNNIEYSKFDIKSIIAFHSICARYMGIKKDFEKSLHLCKLGIVLSRKNYVYSSLANLYSYKALGEKHLEYSKETIKTTLTNLFLVLRLENDTKKSELFRNVVYKWFGIKESDLIEYK